MAQFSEAYQGTGASVHIVPKNSTDFSAGDAVIVDHLTGRLDVLTSTRAKELQFAGFVDQKWTQAIAIDQFGVTAAYSDPNTYNVKLKVHKRGVFKVAISDTSGYAGAPVYYSSGATGAQIFTVTKPTTAQANIQVGVLSEDFSGATANDPQKILIGMSADQFYQGILYYLRNHVISGLTVAFDSSSKVSYKQGTCFVDGKFYSIPYASAALAIACASHTGRRCILYVINSAGAIALVDTGANTFTTPATATAMADSAYWPSTSYLVIGVGYLGTASSNLNAGAVRSIQRSITDIQYRRYVN